MEKVRSVVWKMKIKEEEGKDDRDRPNHQTDREALINEGREREEE